MVAFALLLPLMAVPAKATTVLQVPCIKLTSPNVRFGLKDDFAILNRCSAAPCCGMHHAILQTVVPLSQADQISQAKKKEERAVSTQHNAKQKIKN
jgi:hypothetical protein